MLAIVTIAAALMTFDPVRQYGISLFASAGAAGIILGLAARPVLSNLLAGIQIAMTQPIRVEDQVVVEGESGWIETITSTYVVVRIWDLRRMIVPLTYFIEKPFQNWTYESAAQIGSVFLHVDYTVPVERVRQKLDEIVHDEQAVGRQGGRSAGNRHAGSMVQLRALVSARNPGQAWDLRCEVREKLIGFLQAEFPDALPRQRTVTVEPLPADAGQPAGADPRRHWPTAEPIRRPGISPGHGAGEARHEIIRGAI